MTKTFALPEASRSLEAHASRPRRGRLAWMAFAIGFAFAALSLAPGYVSGRGPYWDALLGDVAKGEIGWFYYARDAWHFPLFRIDTYHAPEGSSMVLADALPLFALPAKALYQLFWPTGSMPPIYTGFWVALCLVLQAVCASRLLRALRITDAWPHVAGVVLFCYLPIVLLRFGQAALMAQFFILLALEGYVRAKRDGLRRRQWAVLCALPGLVLLVHPYLAAMCAALVGATVLDQVRDGRLRLRGMLACCVMFAATALGVMGVGGFFSAAGSDFGDYGLYSLNLLSPWIPFPETLSGRLLHTTIPAITGSNQWEGGAYLGAGVFFLVLLAVPGLRHVRTQLRRHAVLFAMLCLVVLFAISQRVGFGEHEILRIPLPDALLHLFSQFRGSGRFVWIPLYVLLVALIVSIVRRYGRAAGTLLAMAAILQVADIGPMQASVRAASASRQPVSIDRAAWTKLIGAHERIFQYPSFECGGLFGHGIPGTKFRELEIDWIAATLGKPTNSAYLARFTKDCRRERDQAGSVTRESGTLFLYRSSDDIGEYLAARGLDTRRCGYLDDVAVCSVDVDVSSLR